MKTCPFCAEEIQDEAIVCRYCGRALAPAAPASSPPAVALSAATATAPKQKMSVWVSGALLALIPAAGGALSLLSTRGGAEAIGDLCIGTPIAYAVFWWPASTFVVWLWRKSRLAAIVVMALPFLAICLGWLLLAITSGGAYR